jgi:hypothetical protein
VAKFNLDRMMRRLFVMTDVIERCWSLTFPGTPALATTVIAVDVTSRMVKSTVIGGICNHRGEMRRRAWDSRQRGVCAGQLSHRRRRIELDNLDQRRFHMTMQHQRAVRRPYRTKQCDREHNTGEADDHLACE